MEIQLVRRTLLRRSTFRLVTVAGLVLASVASCTSESSTENSTDSESSSATSLALAASDSATIDAEASTALAAMVAPIEIRSIEAVTVESIATSYSGGGAERELLTVEIRGVSDLAPAEMAERIHAQPPVGPISTPGRMRSDDGTTWVIDHGPLDDHPPIGDDYGGWSSPVTKVIDNGTGSTVTTVLEAGRQSRRQGGAIHQTEPTAPMRFFVESGPSLVPLSSTATWHRSKPWGLSASLTLRGSIDNRYEFQMWVYDNAGESNYAPDQTGGSARFPGDQPVDLRWQEGPDHDVVEVEFDFLLDDSTGAADSSSTRRPEPGASISG